MSHEITGRPTSFFEYTDSEDHVHRVRYHVFSYRSLDPAALVRFMESTLECAKILSRNNGKGELPVLFWRVKPELTLVDPEGFTPGWTLYWRYAMVPELTDAQWKELGETGEGSAPQELPQ